MFAFAQGATLLNIWYMRSSTVFYVTPISDFSGENQCYKNIALDIAKFVYFNLRLTLTSDGANIEKYNGGEVMEKYIIQAIGRLGLDGFIVQGNSIVKYKEEVLMGAVDTETEGVDTETEDVVVKPKKKKSKPENDFYDA